MIRYFLLCLVFLPFNTRGQELPADTTEICSIISKMRASDQLYRKGDILKNWNTDKYKKSDIDSVWALQKEIDNYNTETLIMLTKKHGWLSEERLSCDFKPLVFLIFRHSQEAYFEEILPLIDNALTIGHLSEFHHKIVKNHLEGRPRF